MFYVWKTPLKNEKQNHPIHDECIGWVYIWFNYTCITEEVNIVLEVDHNVLTPCGVAGSKFNKNKIIIN